MKFKTETEIFSSLNVMLVMKHGNIFNIDGKIPDWDWVIEKLDEIVTDWEVIKYESIR
jgi:hypothetical protein